MANRIDLSIIIVNYNTKNLLGQCLRSIYTLYPIPYTLEIIIVDNGSTDGSKEYLEKLQNSKTQKLKTNKNFKIKIIKNKKNFGFARANNQGIRQAQGEYILFLNPDTIVLNNAPFKMVEWLGRHPKVGILGCQILNKEKKICSSGGFFPTTWRVILWMSSLDHFSPVARTFGAYHLPVSFFSAQRELDWVQGCALMARKEVLEKISGFDDSFFMYAEEIELCLRTKKVGWQVWFTPKAQIVHLGKGKTERPILGEYKSLLYFFKKHFPFWHFSVLKLLLRLGAVLRIVFFGIIKKDEKLKKIYFQAFQLAR